VDNQNINWTFIDGQNFHELSTISEQIPGLISISELSLYEEQKDEIIKRIKCWLLATLVYESFVLTKNQTKELLSYINDNYLSINCFLNNY